MTNSDQQIIVAMARLAANLHKLGSLNPTKYEGSEYRSRSVVCLSEAIKLDRAIAEQSYKAEMDRALDG